MHSCHFTSKGSVYCCDILCGPRHEANVIDLQLTHDFCGTHLPLSPVHPDALAVIVVKNLTYKMGQRSVVCLVLVDLHFF